MPLHLYQPLYWWSGGALRWLDSVAEITPYDAASLVRLHYATYLQDEDPPFFGETMSDDFSSRVRLVSAPASEPVSLAQAKSFLRIEHTADDAAITLAIAAARQQAEQHLRLALLPQSWELVQANPQQSTLRLMVGPAQSITSVTLIDKAGEETLMDASAYRLSVDGFAVIFETVPKAQMLQLRYVAYVAASAEELPALIIQGILHHMAVMLEQRDGAAALPMQSVTSYAPYRRISL